MTEYKIVPLVATPIMWSEMFRIIKEEGKDCQEAYQAALSAAPDTSHLVVVERERLVKLEQIEAAALKLGNTDINDTNAIDAADNELWRLLDDK